MTKAPPDVWRGPLDTLPPAQSFLNKVKCYVTFFWCVKHNSNKTLLLFETCQTLLKITRQMILQIKHIFQLTSPPPYLRLPAHIWSSGKYQNLNICSWQGKYLPRFLIRSLKFKSSGKYENLKGCSWQWKYLPGCQNQNSHHGKLSATLPFDFDGMLNLFQLVRTKPISVQNYEGYWVYYFMSHVWGATLNFSDPKSWNFCTFAFCAGNWFFLIQKIETLVHLLPMKETEFFWSKKCELFFIYFL